MLSEREASRFRANYEHLPWIGKLRLIRCLILDWHKAMSALSIATLDASTTAKEKIALNEQARRIDYGTVAR